MSQGTKSLQVCQTLSDPMHCNPPGSTVHGIFQARTLEWAATSSSRDLPNPGIKPASPLSPILAGEFFTTELLGSLNYLVAPIKLQHRTGLQIGFGGRNYSQSWFYCASLYSALQITALFTNGRFVATLHQATFLTSFFQQHLSRCVLVSNSGNP